jgi:hypothetical protein
MSYVRMTYAPKVSLGSVEKTTAKRRGKSCQVYGLHELQFMRQRDAKLRHAIDSIVIQAMSISIYYTARRDRPLSTEERAVVDEFIAKYAIEDQLEEFFRTGEGFNWESFCVYERPTPVSPT